MYSYNEIPLASLNIYRNSLNEIGITIDKEKFYTFKEVNQIYSQIKEHSNLLLNQESDLFKAFNKIKRTIDLYKKHYWELEHDFCLRLTESWGLSELPGEKEIALFEDGSSYILYNHDRSFVENNKSSQYYNYPKRFKKALENLSPNKMSQLYDYIFQNNLLTNQTQSRTCDWGATLSIVWDDKCNMYSLDHDEYNKHLHFLEQLLSFNDNDVYKEMTIYHFKRGQEMAEYYGLLYEDLKQEGFFDDIN